MTRDEALADADAEISRLIADGRGLFYIAELYGVPVRRHASRWFDSMDRAHLALPDYLQGHYGTLTLGYLRDALADIAQRIAHAEKEEAGEPADSQPCLPYSSSGARLAEPNAIFTTCEPIKLDIVTKWLRTHKLSSRRG